MNKFRVTCLLSADEAYRDEDRRVFATRKKFETREEAEKYAATIDESRKPMVAYCTLDSEFMCGHWTIWDDDCGPEDECYTERGDRFDELDFMFEFCDETDRCTVFMYGVPCGGKYDAPDEGGSGYMRCNRCSML